MVIIYNKTIHMKTERAVVLRLEKNDENYMI